MVTVELTTNQAAGLTGPAVSTNRVIYVSKAGNDITGTGTQFAPYLTIKKGTDVAATISPTATSPVLVSVGPGQFTESALTLNPFVYVDGAGIGATRWLTGTVSWGATSYASNYISRLHTDCIFTFTGDLGITYTGIYFDNCRLNCEIMTGVGDGTKATYRNCGSGSPDNAANGSLVTCTVGNHHFFDCNDIIITAGTEYAGATTTNVFVTNCRLDSFNIKSSANNSIATATLRQTRVIGDSNVNFHTGTGALTLNHDNEFDPTGLTGAALTTRTVITLPYIGSVDTRSGPGAVSVTKETTKVTTTGVLNALTLANGFDGQIKRIVHDVDGGSFVLTPTTKTGFTTYTSTVVGESITLVFVTTRGWMVVGSYLGVIA